MSLNLVFVADKCYVEEIFLLPELSKCYADVGFEVRPRQTKLLASHLRNYLSSFEWDSGTLSIMHTLEVIHNDFLKSVLFRKSRFTQY